MKFFTNKKFLFKLIATVCLCLTIFNFCTVPKVQASGDLISKMGGKLLDPVCSLLLALGDGVMETLQKAVMGTSATVIFDNPTEGWWLTAIKNIVTVLAIVTLVVATGLISLPVLLSSVAAIAVKVAIGGFIVNAITGGAVSAALSAVSADFFGETIVLPTFTIGPQEIFAGRILLFDANIFNPKVVESETTTDPDGGEFTTYYYMEDGNKIPTSKNNAAFELKETIAKWYYAIRNIALIGLMLVLLYVGIRMLLSSIAPEKAKYRQMLGDWIVALCLVFLMQYIMVFANSFVEGVTDIFSNLAENKTYFSIIHEPSDKLIESVNELGDGYVQSSADGDIIVWPTNLMGQMRLAAQQADGTSGYIGYTICYVVLVLFTIFFAFTYAKRLLYLLFLTVIAPFVALTYPLDKIRDGQAQAFNTWMKEYIINLIIQPFHLLLYTIFVSMAFDLAGSNIIYSLVVLGFMIPAEKFLRSMFGFNKANTPGFLAGPAGAAMTISAIKALSGFAGGKGAGGKNSGEKGSGGTTGSNNRLRTSDPGYTTDNIMEKAVAAGGSGVVRDANRGGNTEQSEERGYSNPEESSPFEDDFNDNQTAQQRMLDAYDENYGTDQWDSAEREALAREAYLDDVADQNNYTSDEEYAERLREQGLSEDEIKEHMGNNYIVPEEQGQSGIRMIEEQSEEPMLEEQVEELIPEYEEENNNAGRFRRMLNKTKTGNAILEKTDGIKESIKGTPMHLKRKLSDTKNSIKNAPGYIDARASNAIRNINKEKMKETAKNVTRGVIKGAVKYGVGATGAAIGVAAGIASGSPGDAFKYATAGAYAGSSIGKGLTNRTQTTIARQEQIHEDTLKRQYGDKEYRKMKNEELDKEFRNNSEIRKKYALKFGTKNKKELDQIMDDAIEYRKYGVTDDDTIMKAMSINPNSRAESISIAAAKLSATSKSQKDFETTMKRFAKTNGVTKDHIDEMERRIKIINKSTLN